MATTFVADSFLGSGAVVGSAPPTRAGSVGVWTAPGGEYDAGGGSWERSATGALRTFSDTGDGASTLRVSGEASLEALPGTTVVEAAVWGHTSLELFFFPSSSLRVERRSDSTWNFYADGSLSLSPLSDARSATTAAQRNVIRIEISPTGTASAWLNGAPFANTFNYTFGVGSNWHLLDISLVTLTTSTLEGGAPYIYRTEYVNVVLDTVSGALGAPAGPTQGGTLLLPHTLSMLGGEYRKGRAGLLLPALYAPERPPAPSFWADRLRARETA